MPSARTPGTFTSDLRCVRGTGPERTEAHPNSAAAMAASRSASGIPLGSLPPAVAMSPLPPPPPPTARAASWISAEAGRSLPGATAATSATPPRGGLAAEHDDAHAGLLAHGDGEVAQVARREPVDLGDDDAVVGDGCEFRGSPDGELPAQRLDLVVERPDLVEAPLHAVERGRRPGRRRAGPRRRSGPRRAGAGPRWPHR